jgi:hypothetical protein
MDTLYPPIDVIENELFTPSINLICRSAAADSSVTPKLKKALANNADAQQLIKKIKEKQSVSNETQASITTLPAFLREQIRRRRKVLSAQFSPVPTAGQILRIDEIRDWDLPRPLAVLLSEPTETPSVWYGWIVASETDYATNWDMLLEPEDEPFDPIAGMIQIWNPVYIYIPSTSRVLAELKPSRMKAVQALATEFITNQASKESPNPGYIAPRLTLKSYSVLTGSPLGNENDPRHRYQTLYHTVAEAILELARLAVEATQPQTFENVEQYLKQFLTDFQQQAKEVLDSFLTPVPAVAFAMGGLVGAAICGAAMGYEDSKEHYKLGDSLHLHFDFKSEYKVLKLNCRLEKPTPWRISIQRGDNILDSRLLEQVGNEETFLLNVKQDLTLVFENISTGKRLEKQWKGFHKNTAS